MPYTVDQMRAAIEAAQAAVSEVIAEGVHNDGDATMLLLAALSGPGVQAPTMTFEQAVELHRESMLADVKAVVELRQAAAARRSRRGPTIN